MKKVFFIIFAVSFLFLNSCGKNNEKNIKNSLSKKMENLNNHNTSHISNSNNEAIFNYNNIWVSPEKRGKDVQFEIVEIDNPNHQKIGMESLGYISEP